jgi:hypothetical protein
MPRCPLALAAFLLVTSPVLVCQELPKATKHQNVTWFVCLSIKFKINQEEEAQKIIDQYFAPADKAVGREVIAFKCVSGKWDTIVFLPLRDGINDLTWKVSPTDEKWFAAIAKIAGGADKANEVLAKWTGLIMELDRDIVMRQM